MSRAEAIGVDLGGTKMLLGVLDSGSEAAWESREGSAGESESELVELLLREIEQARAARAGIEVVGLGIPARIDHEKGIAISAVNLPLEGLPVRDIVAERTGLPVFVDNDANVAALAEQLYGAARGARNAVLLTIGTGIGGGLVLDGEIYRGTIGAGAELGHISIEMDGPPCQGSCPGRGCLETFASGTAIGREGRAAAEREPGSALGRLLAAGAEVDGRAVTVAARAGDEAAVGVLEEVGRRLGVGLANLANVFEPEVIVIGGGAIAAGDLLLEPARAELGGDAGMIGAAAMARIELERAAG
jgi:glucokinase